MTEAHKERLWFLGGWRTGGWRQNLRPGKKWGQHLGYLVKHGLIETDGHGMYRITDAGLVAIGETP